ncbi:MAG: lysophospholipid acyltransferase family protein [Nitratireductor sp.]|nr:lysophospholipid acyltransferase family protein [Nitratireductor sp.]
MASEPKSLPRRRRKTPKWLRAPGRLLSGNTVFAAVAAWLGVIWLKFVFHTNKWVVEPDNALDMAKPHLPAIATVWHGQHILLPVIPIGLKASVMISRSIDGEITARIAQAFGAKTIRASGGREKSRIIEKGGMMGFLEMLSALERGENVLQTADVPKGTPRRAGLGIIRLAKRSGRPVIPIAVASSRRWVAKRAWDRTTVNLPFGRSAICMGVPLHVPRDASDDRLEDCRLALENELKRITARAYDLTGNPE